MERSLREQISEVLNDIAAAARMSEGLTAECERRLGAVYDEAEARGDGDTMTLVVQVWGDISTLDVSNMTIKERSEMLSRLSSEVLQERDDAIYDLEREKFQHRALVDDLVAVNRDNPLVNGVVEVVEDRIGDEALAAAYCMATEEVYDNAYDEAYDEVYDALYDGIEKLCGRRDQALGFIQALRGDFEISEDQRRRLIRLIAEIATEFEAVLRRARGKT